MESTDCLRQALRCQWLNTIFAGRSYALGWLAGDASFRSYFRVAHDQGTWILMDAPPPQEDVGAFVGLRDLIGELGGRVPQVHAADLAQGFLLLEDFGDVQFVQGLNETVAPLRYGQALKQLAQVQGAFTEQSVVLPPYTAEKLASEMDLLTQWYLPYELGATLPEGLSADFEGFKARLIESALMQPQTFVHRDYHARNLMVLDESALGWIDFQDALHGPVTYDAVSLLKDAYVTWPRADQLRWLAQYYAQLPLQLQGGEFAQFVRWFDAMGVQRHLKVVGIFARLAHRDGKSAYLGDVPRVLAYLTEMADLYEEFAPLRALLAWMDAQKAAR